MGQKISFPVTRLDKNQEHSRTKEPMKLSQFVSYGQKIIKRYGRPQGTSQNETKNKKFSSLKKSDSESTFILPFLKEDKTEESTQDFFYNGEVPSKQSSRKEENISERVDYTTYDVIDIQPPSSW